MAQPNKLNEGSEFTIPLKNLIALIAFTGIAVWGYFGITERLTFIERELLNNKRCSKVKDRNRTVKIRTRILKGNGVQEMKYTKDLIVLVLVMGLMGILGLIVVDEFMMANEHGGELDESVIGLLQMSLTGVIGIVGGYIGGKSNGN